MRHHIEKEQVLDFLTGLNINLDDVHGHVVARVPFPTSYYVFPEIWHEEKHHKVMLPDDVIAPPPNFDVSTLIFIKAPPLGAVKENVITAIVLATPKTSVGRFMENRQIGSQRKCLMGVDPS